MLHQLCTIEGGNKTTMFEKFVRKKGTSFTYLRAFRVGICIVRAHILKRT